MGDRYKYFKEGDIVTSFSIWGTYDKFELKRFMGNDYCPIIVAKSVDSKKEINVFIPFINLVDAKKRPFRNVETKKLMKLLNNEEVKRELLMRNNCKYYV